jgi:hypothetical protein
MSARERVEAFLRERGAAAYCAACLGRDAKIAPLETQNAMWALHDSPGFVLRTGACSSCRRTKRVIAAATQKAVTGPEAAVISFLLGRRGEDLCDACLALGAKVSLEEARHAVVYLQALPEFSRRTGRCGDCGRTTPVIAAPAIEAGVDGEAGDAAGMVSGTVRYRGWRIDILSYRLGDRWRPFVAINAPARVAVPGSLSAFREEFATRAEADHFALARAREWIDKRD